MLPFTRKKNLQKSCLIKEFCKNWEKINRGKSNQLIINIIININ